MNDPRVQARADFEIYWAWYDRLTRQQRQEHYAHKSAHKGKILHYDNTVRQLKGVRQELKNRGMK